MKPKRNIVRNAMLLVLLVSGVLMVAGVVIFHYFLGLSWIDSIYFVVTTMTTVGYGDFNLQDASPAIKLFGIFLMVSGAASMAATFGILTDLLLPIQLREILGRRRRRMAKHIILCGLGHLGMRVLENLGSKEN
jgi:voltage-gated potassium channel